MGLIEAWGTGIRRIKEAAKSYGLPSPEILVYDDMFRVNLYRNKTAERLYDYYTLLEETPPVIGEASEIHRRSIGDNSEQI
jgi:predicted HTH transcriptional regulator